MKDEKVCTWCNRTGHYANHCPDPKPEYRWLDIGRLRVKVETGTGNYAEAVYMPNKMEALKAKE